MRLVWSVGPPRFIVIAPLRLSIPLFARATYRGGDLNNCFSNVGGTIFAGCGDVYSLNIGAAPFASLVSTSGTEGAKIGILGQGFTSSSVVKFGGTQATTIQRSGTTFISATVPAAALTGSVTVTTSNQSMQLTAGRRINNFLMIRFLSLFATRAPARRT
jgi:hypothetical protein